MLSSLLSSLRCNSLAVAGGGTSSLQLELQLCIPARYRDGATLADCPTVKEKEQKVKKRKRSDDTAN
jgi:hypothetical protein